MCYRRFKSSFCCCYDLRIGSTETVEVLTERATGQSGYDSSSQGQYTQNGWLQLTPLDLNHCKSFDTYKTRLKVWEATTPAPINKHGAIIASSLPNEGKRWPKICKTRSLSRLTETN